MLRTRNESRGAPASWLSASGPADGSSAAMLIGIYRTGQTLSAAGETAGVRNANRQRGILHGAGVPMRERGGRMRTVPLPPVAEVMTRYADGEGTVAIGRAYDVSYELILGILEGAGVERRDKSAALREWHRRATPEQRREMARPKTAKGAAAKAAAVRNGGVAASARGRAIRLRRELLERRDALLDAALESGEADRIRLVAHADGLMEAVTGLEAILRETRRGRRRGQARA